MSQRSNTTAIPISPQAPASQRKRDASGTKHIYIEHIMFFPRYPDQQKRSTAISKFRDAWLRHIANEILGVCTHYSGYAQPFMNIRDRRSRNWRHEVCLQRANIYLAKHTLTVSSLLPFSSHSLFLSLYILLSIVRRYYSEWRAGNARSLSTTDPTYHVTHWSWRL